MVNHNHIQKTDKPVDPPLKQRGFQFFAGIGRFSVKFRWLVVIIWIVGTIAAGHFLPSLSSVTQSNNSSFLPANAPSQKAIDLASSFGKSASAPTVGVVAATSNGSALTAADEQYMTSLQNSLSGVTGVQGTRTGGISSDGQAEEFDVIVSSSVNSDPTGIITNVRDAINKTTAPSGLQVHLTGQLADSVDNSKKSGSTNTQIQLGAVIFIIFLLLLIFRAPLAPIVTLIPPVLVVSLSGPVIAEAAKHGLKVSSLSQLLLTVLIIGAGTDYGLFLIFRVREEIQRGMVPREAIVKALSRVGETITFSAATVIAALLSLLFATFQLYSNLGAPLAIGIGFMLLAGLTLLPALLAIFGRAVFWPSKRTREATKFGFWGRVSSSVIKRPATVLIIGVVIFGCLALFVTQYQSAGFGGTTAAPAGTDSAKGDALITKHYPSNSQNPTGVIFVLPQSVWKNPAPLAVIQSQLTSSSEFTHVTGPLNPNGVALTTQDISSMYQRYGAPVGISSKKGPVADVAMTPAFSRKYEAYQILVNLVSKDGKTVEYAVGLTAGDSGSTKALNATPAIRSSVQLIANNVHATNNGVIGESTALYDISSITNSDLKRVIPIAIIVIGILLAVLLRSLVAPLYLIVSVALSYLASLGVSVIIFMKIDHDPGLTFILPFLMFVFLLALGEDYNILVMTRIREEAHGLSLRKAVSQALTTTGTTVTSAGLVLAGTFGVFAIVGGNGNSEVQEIGLGLALGILMDTFLVRTLLVPAIVVLLGRWNWWPTKHGSWINEEE
jgi:putative drug exporter of the RND superfamily